MNKFSVEFSNKHTSDWSDTPMYQTKLVSKTACPVLGIESKSTYYLWGVKQLEGIVSLNIDDYNIKKEEVEIDGKKLTLKRIVGLK